MYITCNPSHFIRSRPSLVRGPLRYIVMRVCPLCPVHLSAYLGATSLRNFNVKMVVVAKIRPTWTRAAACACALCTSLCGLDLQTKASNKLQLAFHKFGLFKTCLSHVKVKIAIFAVEHAGKAQGARASASARALRKGEADSI